MAFTTTSAAKALTATTPVALSTLEVACVGYESACLQVTGAGTYTLAVWGSVNGTDFLQMTGISIADDITGANTFTAPGVKRYKVAGLTKLQAICSAHTNDPTVQFGLEG